MNTIDPLVFRRAPETQARLDQLAGCEQVITDNLQGFINAGTALARIRDERLYLQDHSRFDDYVDERWGFKRRYARQLIKSASVGTIVLTAFPDAIEKHGLNEGQARVLAALDEDQAVEVYRETTTKNPTGVTAAKLRETRQALYPSTPRTKSTAREKKAAANTKLAKPEIDRKTTEAIVGEAIGRVERDPYHCILRSCLTEPAALALDLIRVAKELQIETKVRAVAPTATAHQRQLLCGPLGTLIDSLKVAYDAVLDLPTS